MAEMRTIEIPAELYERLEQQAGQQGLSVPDYLDALSEAPLSLAEKLQAEGKSPLLAFVGIADDPNDPHLSKEVRQVMADFSEKAWADKDDKGSD